MVVQRMLAVERHAHACEVQALQAELAQLKGKAGAEAPAPMEE